MTKVLIAVGACLILSIAAMADPQVQFPITTNDNSVDQVGVRIRTRRPWKTRQAR